MPLPNGTDPWGKFHPTCPSAMYLGNRGILHGIDQKIAKQWAHKAWIACAMQFKGRTLKPLMEPGRYSQLFFLDEVTALAAGHRPCGDCRKRDYQSFKDAWKIAHQKNGFVSSDDMDKVIHEHRVTPDKSKRTFSSSIVSLPSGTMFEHQGVAWLKWGTEVLKWSPSGYTDVGNADSKTVVEVLTPAPVVAVLMAGYVPDVHETATALTRSAIR